MNELDARRRLLSDPHDVGEGLEEFLRARPALRATRDELLALDERLRHEITRSHVPDGLADRLILHARYPRRRPWALGIAASFLAIALTTRLVTEVEPPALEDAMIAHVVAGTDELLDDAGIKPAVLQAAVSELGVRVRDTDFGFRHLARCVVAGREGRHFTVNGPNGTVTFLVVPGRGRGEGPFLAESRGTRALFMQRAGNTVGVFADARTSRAELERLFDAVIA